VKAPWGLEAPTPSPIFVTPPLLTCRTVLNARKQTSSGQRWLRAWAVVPPHLQAPGLEGEAAPAA